MRFAFDVSLVCDQFNCTVGHRELNVGIYQGYRYVVVKGSNQILMLTLETNKSDPTKLNLSQVNIALFKSALYKCGHVVIHFPALYENPTLF